MGRFENSDEFTCLFKISVSRKWNVVCNKKNENSSNQAHEKQLSSSAVDTSNPRPRTNTGQPMQLFIEPFNSTQHPNSAESAVSCFTAVNHLCGPLRKQPLTLTSFKGHVWVLWLVDFDSFCSFLFFTVCWLTIVVVVRIDGSQKSNRWLGFKLQSWCFTKKRNRNQTDWVVFVT